jgi:hypothetical protein
MLGAASTLCTVLAACLFVTTRLLEQVRVNHPITWRRLGRPRALEFALMMGPPSDLSKALPTLGDPEVTALVGRCPLSRRIGLIWTAAVLAVAVRECNQVC